MKRIIIFGGGDTARSAYVYLTRDSPFEVAAFTAHDAGPGKDSLLGRELVPFNEIQARYPPSDFAMFVAISYRKLNQNRIDVYNACREMGYELVSYISSKASCWDENDIGSNCYILEQAAIQPFARIGHDVVLCVGSIIGHDSVIGDHCFVGPGAVVSGRVRMGEACFIGANAFIRDGVTVGDGCVIGAGSLVLHDAKAGQVYLTQATRPSAFTAAGIRPFFGMPIAHADSTK